MIDMKMDRMLREMPEPDRYGGLRIMDALAPNGYTREQWNEWVKDNPRKETV